MESSWVVKENNPAPSIFRQAEMHTAREAGERPFDNINEETAFNTCTIGLKAEHKARESDAEKVDERHLDGLEGIRRERDTDGGKPPSRRASS